ncbi:PREDICTED: papilin-like isoform X4 [Priapulus caudatus]|uniref:Papilin-like isoform X4 n=1 Tax=Priapulus caudatus TaxID=37621 RepID=A0ABM1EAT7_PRICU|nr:PREDICTED: papilin-like isoform X4 [Priapulus caudatus]
MILRLAVTIELLISLHLVLSSQDTHLASHVRTKRSPDPRLLTREYIVDRSGPDSGAWGPWSGESPCSRSCGGGITYHHRKCLSTRSDGSADCTGASKIYKSCQIQDCPSGSKDFRDEQCAKYDSTPFQNQTYEWIPYANALSECDLNCRPRTEKFYYKFAAAVDGTRCNAESTDICVNGICRPVGCDKLLGSSAKEDKCRECGGDGSTCKTVEGLFDISNLQTGYNDMIIIPGGATNIHLRERKATNNFLAIRDIHGTYYLNGEWRIDSSKDMQIAGTTFYYKRTPHGFHAPEQLDALGPTTETLFIVLLLQEANPGVIYEYSIPLGVTMADPDSYAWIYDGWGECSQTCGGGIQTRPVYCARTIGYDTVSEVLCNPLLRPPTEQSCHTQACPASWYLGEWEECSNPCGGGLQFRIVYCQQQAKHGIVSQVLEQQCVDADGEKPTYKQECNVDEMCPHWQASKWGPCDKMCGKGEQTRTLTCHAPGSNDTLPEDNCDESHMPSTNRTCDAGPCEGLEWMTSEWTECDACGQTKQSRDVICVSKKGVIYDDSKCDELRKPDSVSDCPVMSPKCEAAWHMSEWSTCSGTCGKGVQTRHVMCVAASDEDSSCISPASEELCMTERPTEQQDCMNEPCEAVWFTGPWALCSVPCGGGVRKREVMCLSDGKKVNKGDCDPNDRPFDNEPCNQNACDEDVLMPVEGCHKSKFGCCEDGVTPAKPNRENCRMVETGIPCNETAYGCCMDGITAAAGPFKKGCAMVHSCNESRFGCCPDGITPAKGDEGEGCLEEDDCETSSYGCCADGVTAASGPLFAGCESEPTTPPTETMAFTNDTETIANMTSTETPVDMSSETPVDMSTETPVDMVTTEIMSSESGTQAMYDMLSTEAPGIMSTDVTLEGTGFTEGLTTTPDYVLPTRGKPVIDSHVKDIVSGMTTQSQMSTEDVGVTTSAAVNASEPDTMVTKMTDTDTMVTQVTEMVSEVTEQETDVVQHTTSIFVSEVPCIETPYGCCPDGVTAAASHDYEGCEFMTVAPCASTAFGCCLDNISAAAGPNMEGCEEEIEGGFISTGEGSAMGCIGLDEAGSGCIPDTVVPPYVSPMPECEESEFGCCPDGITIALDEDWENCPIETTEVAATVTEMAENVTEVEMTTSSEGLITGTEEMPTATEQMITGTEGMATATVQMTTGTEGMATATVQTTTGTEVMPNVTMEVMTGTEEVLTTAVGTGIEENVTTEIMTTSMPEVTESSTIDTSLIQVIETTTGLSVSACSVSQWGCCMDGVRPAIGPDFEGCQLEDCRNSLFGCCEDGMNEAQGPNMEGCVMTTTAAATRVACDVPKDEGPCSAYEIKWYFDIEKGVCDRFWYGGCEGNDNKFTTMEECETSCTAPEEPDTCFLPAMVGPCSESVPRFYYDQDVGECRQFTYGGCGGNTNRFADKAVCESQCLTQDVCSQPKVVGPCSGRFERYHYDVTTDRCKMFKYSGCKGNQNNFVDEYDCISQCVEKLEKDICSLPKEVGTCHGTFPRWVYDSSTGLCEKFIYSGCHGNKNRFFTKGECETHCNSTRSLRDVCTMPKVEGSCSENLVRWFYDIYNGQCKPFYYGGCEGNGNRFESRDECARVCGDMSTLGPADVCSLPKEVGPCQERQEKWFYDAAQMRCVMFHYGGCEGNNNRFNTQYECENRCLAETHTPMYIATAAPEDICTLPKEAGPCGNWVATWWFDSNDGICKPFYYGGCDGNDNRFDTPDECRQRCGRLATTLPPTTAAPTVEQVSVCELPLDAGPCDDYQERWRYDQATGRCQSFKWGGCRGNHNNFQTEQLCQDYCGGIVEEDVCSMPSDPGPCEAYTTAWYYDNEIGQCATFAYGGCEGNANRYDNREGCERACGIYQTQDWCNMPKDPGPCRAGLQMYYHDNKVGKCQQFTYGGCHGNGNRFKTIEECEDTCGKMVALTTTPQPTQTQPVRLTREDICLMGHQTGRCNDRVLRHYYDAGVGSCKEFTYSGCGGNQNNFGEKSDCERYCSGVKSEDTCQLDKDAGPCLAYIESWFYDKQTRQCAEFVYGGCQGNANRFESKSECEQKCITELVTEPTPTRPPHTEAPEGQEQCYQPKDEGTCDEYVLRWYFDAERDGGRCAPFWYGGCQGNSNNYGSQQECEDGCVSGAVVATKPPVYTTVLPVETTQATMAGEPSQYDICHQQKDTGPCEDFEVRWYFSEEQGNRCAPFYYGGCEANKNNFETYQECFDSCHGVTAPPATTSTRAPVTRPTEPYDLCQLPKDAGPCSDFNMWWYFDTERERCAAFYYGGCEGNDNRFESLEECESECTRRPETTMPIRTRPEVTKPTITTETPSSYDICDQEKQPGTCSDYQLRWYFSDEDGGRCAPFYYGGCEGNENNFASYEECNDFCSAATRPAKVTEQPTTVAIAQKTTMLQVETTEPEEVDAYGVCHLEVDPGPCADYVLRWHYSQEKGDRCAPFYYGGCEGNANNYQTYDECDAICSGATAPSTTQASVIETTMASYTTETVTEITEEVVEGTEKPSAYDICREPLQAGPCGDFILSWYFAPEKGDRCAPFYYGGCEGNGNRFGTYDECASFCTGALPQATTHPVTETSKTKPTHETMTTVAPTTVLTTTMRPMQTTEKPSKYDICQQPKEAGPCDSYVLRWYFSAEDGDRCAPFYYGGCEGNENNFETHQDCSDFCSGASLTVLPPTEASTGVTHLETKTTEMVPEATTEMVPEATTEMVPEATTEMEPEATTEMEPDYSTVSSTVIDICELPKEPGSCNEFVLRWYYSTEDGGRCAPFYYGGCEGNENNFETHDECSNACPRATEPVTTPEAETTEVAATTKELSEYEACQMPQDPGPCNDMKMLWYFSTETKQCKPFYYGGCKGNKNNFATYRECYAFCVDTTPQPTTQPTAPTSTFAETEATLSTVATEATDAATLLVTSSVVVDDSMSTDSGVISEGPDMVTEGEEIQQTTFPSEKELGQYEICQQPKEGGPCYNYVLRWYFSTEDGGRCAPFYYGGCEGNKNNFETHQGCLDFCSVTTPLPSESPLTHTTSATEIETTTQKVTTEGTTKVCQQPKESGPCDDHVLRWYFSDEDGGRCAPFYYGGCEGNENNFETYQDCSDFCSVTTEVPATTTSPSDELTEVAPTADEKLSTYEICQQPKEAGPCDSYVLSWYFSAEDGDRCAPFYYGGCEGNENNFETHQDCSDFCSGAKPVEATKTPEETTFAPVDGTSMMPDTTSMPDTGVEGTTEPEQVEMTTFMEEMVTSAAKLTPYETCRLAKDSGPCDSYTVQWFFDAENDNRCAPFYYGGCDGNDNRFATFDECNDFCSKAAPCPLLDDCEKKCEFGQLYDDKGCPTCQCSPDPCQDHYCSEDEECVVVEVNCITAPCHPTAECRTKMGPTEIPAVPTFPYVTEPEAPVIISGSSAIQVQQGSDAMLPCVAIGSPTPSITWFKGSDAILGKNSRIKQDKNGALKIEAVAQEDAGSYTCRAFNGIGPQADLTIPLIVEVPARIEGVIYEKVKGVIGESLELHCPAYGVPVPEVIWQKGSTGVTEQQQRADSTWARRYGPIRLPSSNPRFTVYSNYSLVISPVQEGDDGVYGCMARNGLGPTERKIISLTLNEPVKAVILTHTSAYDTGDVVSLQCVGSGYPQPRIDWTFNGLPLYTTGRREVYGNGTLVLHDVSKADDGRYSCKVSNQQSSSSTSTYVNVRTVTKKPDTCRDNPILANCKLIVKARLCGNRYYSKFCCKSCHEAGQLW